MTTASDQNFYTVDPTRQKKVILSVDGGGMRGAIPIAMLAELESRTGKTCQEMFDMVVGTSTGAIIAVGLAVGYTATELLDIVYRDQLPKAFGEANRGWLARILAKLVNRVMPVGEDFLAGLLSNGFKYAYPLEPFQRELVPLLESKGVFKVGDLTYPTHPILLVTTKDVRTSDTYFIVNAGRGKGYFQDWPLSGIVAASGAAPSYFPPVLARLVDGGVGVYSNPCLAAAVEAMEYIGAVEPGDPSFDPALQGFQDGNVILVSLGTGYVPTNLPEQKVARYKVWDWLRYVIFESMDEAALQQVFVTRAIYGRTPDGIQERIDFRRYNPLLTPESVSGELGIPLDGRPNPSTFALNSWREDEVRLMEDIGRRYAEQLPWSRPDTMPWDTVGGHHRPSPRAVFDENMRNAPVEWTKTPYSAGPRPR